MKTALEAAAAAVSAEASIRQSWQALEREDDIRHAAALLEAARFRDRRKENCGQDNNFTKSQNTTGSETLKAAESTIFSEPDVMDLKIELISGKIKSWRDSQLAQTHGNFRPKLFRRKGLVSLFQAYFRNV